MMCAQRDRAESIHEVCALQAAEPQLRRAAIQRNMCQTWASKILFPTLIDSYYNYTI